MERETAIQIFTTMARIVATDTGIQRSLAAGDIQFQYYPCGGQEAIPAAIAPLLEPDDKAVITYRCVHDIVAQGTPIAEIVAEMYGRTTGTSKGKGGPMHLSDPHHGLMVTTGIVGAGAPIAAGLALGEQMLDSGNVVMCSFGDGAANIGAVHEALNLAALWKLPIIFVCQNNLYAEYTSFEQSTASETIAGRAAGYGMVGERTDGTDPARIYEAAGRAIARARAGHGPTLLECVAHRLQGHSFGSEEKHMDAAALSAARACTPFEKYRARLVADGTATDVELAAIIADAEAEVERAKDLAGKAPIPSESAVYDDVFAEKSNIPDLCVESPSGSHAPLPEPGSRKLTLCQAVNEALDQALSSDPDVFLLGEDIEDPAGGVMKATFGLSTKFGRDRVRGTPISEQAIVGAAIGASMLGYRPVAEIMISDFAMVCMDQIANHAAKLRYMSGGRTSVPVTLRMLSAGNMGSFGAQHSQSLEAWFAHIPGLKVVMPSNAYDAKGLLLSCIDDPDPCIFIEPLRCYFSSTPVPEKDYRIPLGQASIVKEGADISLITWGWTVQEALAAADELAAQGISAEVLDLRSIVPLDKRAILQSVRKTGRACVVHSAVEFAGFGAEIATLIHESAWDALKQPVARLGACYSPVPFSQQLETAHFPNADKLTKKVQAMFDLGGQ